MSFQSSCFNVINAEVTGIGVTIMTQSNRLQAKVQTVHLLRLFPKLIALALYSQVIRSDQSSPYLNSRLRTSFQNTFLNGCFPKGLLGVFAIPHSEPFWSLLLRI
jgi:hypothetical protein